MPREVGRTVDLEMDHRGRVIIPKNLRERFEIEPPEGETTWLTVTVEDAVAPDDADES